jgi:hypothetical protein
LTAVEVINHGAWFVPAQSTGLQNPIPEYRVAGTAGCANVKTLVESADFGRLFETTFMV